MIVAVGVAAGGEDVLRRLLAALPADAPLTLLLVAHAKREPPAGSLADPLGVLPLPVVGVHGGETLEQGRVYVVPEGRDSYLAGGVLHLHRKKSPCSQPIDALFSSLAAHSGSVACGVLLSAGDGDGVQGLREIRGAGGAAFAQEREGGSGTVATRILEVADFTGSPEEIASELVRRARRSPSGDSTGEVPSSNEGLHALNEELQTAQEELQSANDELRLNVERMEKRARLSAALNDVDAAIAAAPGAEEIMRTATRVAGVAIGAESATIAQKVEDGWVVRVADGLASDAQGLAMTDEEQPSGMLALQTRAVVPIDDVLGDPRIKSRAPRRLGIRSAMVVPLFDRRRPFGALFLNYHASSHTFTRSEIEYGARLGVSLSLALSNARLHEAERRAARLSTTLNEVNEILRTALTPDELTNRLVGEASAVAGADRSLIIEVRGGRYTVTHVRNVRDDIVGQTHAASFFPAYALAVEERRPLLIGDTWNDPRTNKDFVGPYGLRAFMLIPLRVDDEVVAIVAFAYDEPRTFDAEDERFAAKMATAMSLALRNARAYAAEVERRQRTETLNEVLALVTSSLEPSKVAERALSYVSQRLGVDVITLWAVNESRDRLYPVTGIGFPAEFYDGFAAGVGLNDPYDVATAYREGRPVVRGPGQIEEVPEAVRAAYARFGVPLGALLVLPLRGRGQDIGAVTLAWRGPREIAEDDVTFFSAAVGAVAVGWGNARLYEAEQDALTRATALQAAAVAASSSLDAHEVCQRVQEEVRALPELGATAFYMLDEGRNVLVEMCTSGYPEDMQSWLRELPVDDTNNPGRVIARGMEVLTHEDPGSEPDVAERLAHIGIPDARWITLPTKSAGRVVGSMGLIFRGARSFTTAEVRLYQGLAATVGTALANARLFARVDEASARLSDILSSMTDGFVALDRDWRYTWMNSMAESLMHRPATELLGKSLLEEFPDIEGIAHYRRVMEQRMPETFETFAEPVGTWLEVRAYPMGDGMSIFFADITERKAAETALAQSRERADMLASILENSAQPFGVGAPNGDLLLVNHAFERLTGYSVEELAQISWAETLTPPEYAEFEAQQLALVAETGESVRYEKEYVRKDGTRVPIELLVHAEKDDAGQVRYYYSFVTDLTQRKATDAALETERARLREIIEEVPMGVALVDAHGAVLELNAAHDHIWAGGLPRASSVDEFAMYKGYRLDNGEPMTAEDWPAPRVIATGKPVQEIVEIERFDGTRAPVRISANPIFDEDGALSRVVVVTEDVSQEFERERLAEALSEIGTAITSTLDYEEVLHRVTKLAAQALDAETASLSVLERGEWVMREAVSAGRRKVSSAFGDPVFAQTLTSTSEHTPLVIEDVDTDSRVDAAAMRKLGIRSLMAVPIVAQQKAVGALVFHHRTAKVTFSPEQVDFASRLMAIVTLALENARLYGRELVIANTLQEAILTAPEAIEGFETDYLYRPASETANVGGDFYDVFHIDADHVAVVIGDVSGKGIEAARLTSLLRDGTRAYALQGAAPAQLLGHLNELVHRSSPVEAYATMFFGVLEPGSGVVRYCTAGHPSPAVIGGGTARFLESTRSPILGAFEAVEFDIGQTTIEPGETLVMFTDGVTEARNRGEQFGEARLLPALQKLSTARIQGMSEELLRKVLKFTGDVLFDDTVILCLHRDEAPAD